VWTSMPLRRVTWKPRRQSGGARVSEEGRGVLATLRLGKRSNGPVGLNAEDYVEIGKIRAMAGAEVIARPGPSQTEPLKREQVSRLLQSHGRVDDIAINAYMKVVQEQFPERLAWVADTQVWKAMEATKEGGIYNTRWTRKVDFAKFNLLVFPINISAEIGPEAAKEVVPNHWAIVVVDLREEKLHYYDSMGKKWPKVLRKVAEYLIADHNVKYAKGNPFNYSLIGPNYKARTTVQHGNAVPQQDNTADCGLFAMQFALRVVLGQPLGPGTDLGQADGDQWRMRTLLELRRAKVVENSEDE
jgi:hypothetical protein